MAEPEYTVTVNPKDPAGILDTLAPERRRLYLLDLQKKLRGDRGRRWLDWVRARTDGIAQAYQDKHGEAEDTVVAGERERAETSSSGPAGKPEPSSQGGPTREGSFSDGGMKDATQHVVGHLDDKGKRSFSSTTKANHAAYGLMAQVNAELQKAVRVNAKDKNYGTDFFQSIAGDPDLRSAYFGCLYRLLKKSREWENCVSYWLNENEVVKQAFSRYLANHPSKKGRKPGSKTRWDGSTAGYSTRNSTDQQDRLLKFERETGPQAKFGLLTLRVLYKISAMSHVRTEYVEGACSDHLPLNRNDRERVFKAIEAVLLDRGTSAAMQTELVRLFKIPNVPRTKHRAYILTSSTLSEAEKQKFLTLFFS